MPRHARLSAHVDVATQMSLHERAMMLLMPFSLYADIYLRMPLLIDMADAAVIYLFTPCHAAYALPRCCAIDARCRRFMLMLLICH